MSAATAAWGEPCFLLPSPFSSSRAQGLPVSLWGAPPSWTGRQGSGRYFPFLAPPFSGAALGVARACPVPRAGTSGSSGVVEASRGRAGPPLGCGSDSRPGICHDHRHHHPQPPKSGFTSPSPWPEITGQVAGPGVAMKGGTSGEEGSEVVSWGTQVLAPAHSPTTSAGGAPCSELGSGCLVPSLQGLSGAWLPAGKPLARRDT